MKTLNTLELKRIMDQKELYIAHYDFVNNKGVLSNGDNFEININDTISLADFRLFLSEYEQVKDIKTIKDAIIDGLQKFKNNENKKIFEVVQKIIVTDESALNVEYLAKNIDSLGIDKYAKDLFENLTKTYTDALSQLFNANFYREFLEPKTKNKEEQLVEILTEIGIVDKTQEHHKVGLVYIDLDNLKAINDIISHYAGDRAIEIFGKKLLSLKNITLPIRTGGDEFVLLCKPEDAEIIKEKIEDEVFIDDLNDELNSHIRKEDQILIKQYPFKATCANSFFEIGAKQNTRENFSDALKEADKKLHDLKSSRKENAIYRKLK